MYGHVWIDIQIFELGFGASCQLTILSFTMSQVVLEMVGIA